MNELIRERILVALEVQAMLKRHTEIKPVIAGGFARDVYYNRVPKDCDIIFPNTVSYQALSGFFASLGISSHTILMYRAGEEIDRIKTVNKMTYKGVDFDIIVYDIEPDEEVTDYFDFNFSQFILTGHTAVFKGDPLTWDHDCGGIKTLKRVREDSSAKRCEYVFNKWMEYRKAHNEAQREADL